MLNFISTGGPIMYIQLIQVVILIVLTIKKTFELRHHDENRHAKSETGINAIIFWGLISMVLGFFAHFLGMYEALQVIAEVGSVSPSIIAAGYSVSLIPIIFGLRIFLLSAISWFTLRWQFIKVVVK